MSVVRTLKKTIICLRQFVFVMEILRGLWAVGTHISDRVIN